MRKNKKSKDKKKDNEEKDDDKEDDKDDDKDEKEGEEEHKRKTKASNNKSHSSGLTVERIMMVALLIFLVVSICIFFVKKQISKAPPIRPQRAYGVIQSSSAEFSF